MRDKGINELVSAFVRLQQEFTNCRLCLVGDFEAEWLVNRSGDIRLKAYNETNDRYYTRTNLTTQGIGIIFKKDFNKWSELLFWNRWKLKRLRKEQEIKQDTLSTDKINTEQQMPEAQSKRKREQK